MELTADIKHLFGERFAMLPLTFTMPWGTVYVGLVFVLMYSETSWRFHAHRWIAVGQTYEEAYGKACRYIRADLPE